ncbi:MAG: UDP-4-amino-4,6-dideoxy-N-acetyl-beta-L-altrosamine N-acetyltransferase, partial [Desulfobacteraceae bacterium]|nr:UDP-4-amino-4,6-dideoxy-N-acetyl-beta-L-altrosamine N-acetyltransferase [Desulfobacteraceae bacterium]
MNQIEFVDILGVDDGLKEKVRCWRNKQRIRKSMLLQHEISKEEHLRWIENLKHKDNQKFWVVFVDDVPIGSIYLQNINYDNLNSEWGFYIGEDAYIGKGLAKPIVFKLLEYFFEVMKFKILFTKVFSDNTVALNLYRKFKFDEADRSPVSGCRKIITLSFSRANWINCKRIFKKCTLKMADKKIGTSCPVFLVAEISANHGQDFDRAVALIKKAKQYGADAVKFQAYTPDTVTINVDNKYFRIKHPQWGGQTLYELYKKAYTPWKWFKKLKKVADDSGILFFATAFDRTSVDFLEKLNVRLHKISSFELVDLPLIAYAAKTGKPLIISTGMGDISEIRDAVDTARRAGTDDIILLK